MHNRFINLDVTSFGCPIQPSSELADNNSHTKHLHHVGLKKKIPYKNVFILDWMVHLERKSPTAVYRMFYITALSVAC